VGKSIEFLFKGIADFLIFLNRVFIPSAGDGRSHMATVRVSFPNFRTRRLHGKGKGKTCPTIDKNSLDV
jgi:hypothetical protein